MTITMVYNRNDHFQDGRASLLFASQGNKIRLKYICFIPENITVWPMEEFCVEGMFALEIKRSGLSSYLDTNQPCDLDQQNEKEERKGKLVITGIQVPW